MTTGYNKMQGIKREIYAMRNGIVADTLRRAGSPYRFIMGVNLPQLKEIAARHGYDAELATELRKDRACRESQMLAPMLVDPAGIDVEAAMEWISGAADREAIDILCHSLLRHSPTPFNIAQRTLAPDVADPLTRYAGIRLLWNVYSADPARARALAEGEAASSSLAASLIEELNFLM